MELRKLTGVIGLVAAGTLLAAGCGGTLEGKYRRGQITTSTTGGSRSPATTPGTGASSTTTTAPPTGGNAAGQTALGESKGRHPGSTLVVSAVRRSAVLPLGGRHR